MHRHFKRSVSSIVTIEKRILELNSEKLAEEEKLLLEEMERIQNEMSSVEQVNQEEHSLTQQMNQEEQS